MGANTKVKLVVGGKRSRCNVHFQESPDSWSFIHSFLSDEAQKLYDHPLPWKCACAEWNVFTIWNNVFLPHLFKIESSNKQCRIGYSFAKGGGGGRVLIWLWSLYCILWGLLFHFGPRQNTKHRNNCESALLEKSALSNVSFIQSQLWR